MAISYVNAMHVLYLFLVGFKSHPRVFAIRFTNHLTALNNYIDRAARGMRAWFN